MGFGSDEPVIRQISDQRLYIGNKHAAQPGAHDQFFEHVLSATTDRAARPIATPNSALYELAVISLAAGR